ncbi:MAG: TetR/AcrR family transcriptional regulator, partial [Jannaschia sp.]
LSRHATPELSRAVGRSRGVLEKAAEDLSQHIPAARRPPAAMVSAHIWAMSHGGVELCARGKPGANTPFPPEDLLEAGIGVYLRGLGLVPAET